MNTEIKVKSRRYFVLFDLTWISNWLPDFFFPPVLSGAIGIRTAFLEKNLGLTNISG